jgi:ligand-binding SRPBCC domain-containing protein
VTEHLLRREQRLRATLEQVFPFFADAGNLQRITPPEVGFQIDTPLPVAMRQGALLDYRLRLFGVPFRWRTEITEWDPPHGFVDEQVRGPYRLWRHVHRFEADGDATKMIDEVHYALPLAPIGEIAHFIVRAQLDRIFDFRARAVPEMVEDEAKAERARA